MRGISGVFGETSRVGPFGITEGFFGEILSGGGCGGSAPPFFLNNVEKNSLICFLFIIATVVAIAVIITAEIIAVLFFLSDFSFSKLSVFAIGVVWVNMTI